MFNQVILAGRVVKDPELNTLENGNKVAVIRVATMRPFRSKDTGEYESDFFNVTLWQGMAETAYDKCRKGTLVIIKGRLQDNQFTDKEGKKNYVVQIVGERLIYLSNKEVANAQVVEDSSKDAED